MNESRSIIEGYKDRSSAETAKLTQLSMENNRLKNELHALKNQVFERTEDDKKAGDDAISQLKAQRDSMSYELKDQHSRHEREVDQLKATIAQLKKNLEDENWEKTKAIDNYSRLCEAIKHNVNDTIAKEKKQRPF